MKRGKAEKQTAGIGRGTPGPGRPKGVPNKVTTDLKEMILGALSDAGGRQYLQQQAVRNPAAFLSLIGRVLPMQVTGMLGTYQAVSVPVEEREQAPKGNGHASPSPS